MKQVKFIFISLALIFSLTVLIKIFFIQIYTVESDNMYKTILPGSKVIINKLSRFETGDIVLYKDDLNDQLNLSRIAAIYNDSILSSGQDVFVNNEEVVYKDQTKSYCLRFIKPAEFDILKTKYIIEKLNNSGSYKVELTQDEYDKIINDASSDLRLKIVADEKCTQGIFSSKPEIIKILVAEDSFFLLNDNRSDYYDSRTFGQINKKNIIGKAIYSL